jgi:DNA polymerase III delta subunit
MEQLFLIIGNDDIQIRSKSSEIIKQFCGDDYSQNPSLEIIHGDTPNIKMPALIGEVINAIQSLDLFGSSKTVWLKRFDFSAIGKSKANKAAIEQLTSLIKQGLPDDVVLIMDGSTIDKRSALYKTCTKLGKVLHYTKISVENRNWEKDAKILIQEICAKQQLSVAQDALDFLVSTCGTDSGRFITEIDKLAAFIYPERLITAQACRLICSLTPEAAGWAFSDTLVKKNFVKSLDALNILFNSKAFGTAVIYTVMRRFQELVKVKMQASVLGIPPNASKGVFDNKIVNIHPQLKEKHKGLFLLSIHPFRAWQLFLQASAFTDKELSSALTEILKVNKALVSGGAEPRIALELLAAEICKLK